MKLTAIKKQKIYQSIIEQVKLSIAKGDFQPGDKLPSERDLAKTLSVSRSSVREAISVLESAGIVQVMPGVGVFLKKSDHEDLLAGIDHLLNEKDVKLLELLEIRYALEGQAAYLAAERRTDIELQKIKHAYNNLELAVRSNKVGAEEDYLFHISIVEASHNSLLLQAVKVFSDKFLQAIQESRIKSMKIPGKSSIVLQEHWNIYSAIDNQNPELAQKMMMFHLNSIKERYSGELS